MSHCFRNSSLIIIWNNQDLSNYKRMIVGRAKLEEKLFILQESLPLTMSLLNKDTDTKYTTDSYY